MQSWAVRSCGVCRLRPPCEIGRRSDDRHAHVRPDAHGDHVLGHLLAEPDAGVVALGDDVGEAVVDVHLDPDVRVVGQQLASAGQRIVIGRVLARRDADGAGGLLASSLSAASSASISSKRGADGAQQALARLGRRDAARGAGQQPEAEPLLQPADGVAERGLRDAELRRGPGEAPLLAPPRGKRAGH